MAKMVAFACSVRLLWLNKAAQLYSENLDELTYKSVLNEYLSFEIDGETRLRKTREILMNIWYRDDPHLTALRVEGFRLLQKNPDLAPVVHLCLMFMVYPVVSDICRYMGKLFEFQDEITTAMLKQKLYDEWGERGSLESTARRVTLTLKELNFLEAVSRTRYRVNRVRISDDESVNFILAGSMQVDGRSYYPFSSLTEFPFLFPFDYSVSREQLMGDARFALSTYDATLCVALRQKQQN